MVVYGIFILGEVPSIWRPNLNRIFLILLYISLVCLSKFQHSPSISRYAVFSKAETRQLYSIFRAGLFVKEFEKIRPCGGDLLEPAQLHFPVLQISCLS